MSQKVLEEVSYDSKQPSQSELLQEEQAKMNYFRVIQKLTGICSYEIEIQQIKFLEVHFQNSLFNSVSESEMIEFGEELKNLIELETLYIKVSLFKKANAFVFSSWKEGLRNLSQLRELSLIISELNEIESFNVSEISEAFIFLPLLKSFTLSIGSQNDIKSDGLIKFGQNLKYLHSLESLSLIINYNNISEEGFGYLVGYIGLLTKLQKLSIVYSDSIRNQIGVFSQQLQRCSHSLKELNLQFRQDSTFDETDCFQLGESLAKLQGLDYLYLSLSLYGDIDKGFGYLSKGLAYLKALRKLKFLISNLNLEVGQESISSLGCALQNLTKLNSLRIQIDDSKCLELLYLVSVLPLEKFKLNNIKIPITIQTEQRIELLIRSPIEDKGVQALGVGIIKLFCLLKCLKISLINSRVNQVGMKGLSNSLEHLNHLKQFSFYLDEKSMIEKQGVIYLAKSLRYIALQLIELNITIIDNNLEDEGIEELCLSIGQLVNLEQLSFRIEKNNFGIKSSFAFGSMLKSQQQLHSLHINLSSLDIIPSIGMLEIGTGIMSLLKLQQLSIQIQKGTVDSQGIANLFSGDQTVNFQNKQQLIDKNYQFEDTNIGGSSEMFSYSTLVQKQTLKSQPDENKIKWQNYSSCKSLRKEIRLLDNLQVLKLELGENNISLKGYLDLAAGISQLSSLEKIQLKYRDTNGIMLISCLDGLNKIRSSEQFVINDSQLKFEEIIRDKSKQRVSKLKILFNCNYYEQFSLLGLALNEFKTFSKLTLTIQNQVVDNQSISTFVKEMTQLEYLTSFSLIFNQEKRDGHHLCEFQSIGGLVHLKEFSFQDRITQQVCGQITTAIKQLENLQKLQIKDKFQNKLKYVTNNGFFLSIPNTLIHLQIDLPFRDSEEMKEDLVKKLPLFQNLKEFTFILPLCSERYLLEQKNIINALSKNKKLTYLCLSYQSHIVCLFRPQQMHNLNLSFENTNKLYRKLSRLVNWKNAPLKYYLK